MQEAMMFDVFVIGAGAAGTAVARRCRAAGLTVAIADASDSFGGTCPLRGCEPKKVLATAAESVTGLRDIAGNGVFGEAGIDWPKLMAFKRSFTESIPDRVAASLEKAGITVFRERASFTGPDTLRVGGKELRAAKICIATGADHRRLEIPGEELLLTSDDFLELEELPPRLVFIGGGFIAFEFAFAAAVAGADVTIVNRSERVLRKFDHQLSQRLTERAEELGITVRLNTLSRSVRRTSGGIALTVGEDGTEEIEADAIINGAGRIPAVAALNLEAAGVTLHRGGIEVNEFLQNTGNPRVYAAGDVIPGGVPLTPVAAKEARYLAHNLIHGNEKPMEYGPIPYALFTDPPLASVGLSEEEIQERGIEYEAYTGDAAKWSEYRRLGQKFAGYNILTSKEDGRILGAHLMGLGCDEVINVFALAMARDVTVEELEDMLWAYPSFGYTLRYIFRF